MRMESLEPRLLLSAWTPAIGDANSDGLKNYADYQALEANYGRPGGWAQGDFSGDLFVGFNDYQILEAAYGRDLAPLPAGETYRDFSGYPLFIDGPQFDDTVQGNVGDCYFLAALSSLAQSDPDIIRSMITDRGDGTFNVRFVTGTGTTRYVHIDAQLPVAVAESIKYAKLTPDGELWVALAEKAFAYFRANANTYASLSGGWMSEAYWDVTGVWPQTVTPPGLPGDQLGQYLADNIQAGHAVSAGTTDYPAGPFIGNHAYAVVSVWQDAAGWQVELYNVWGGPTITATLDQFRDNFTQISVSMK